MEGAVFVESHVFSRDELVHSVLPLLKKYHAEQTVLFGSYARQEATAQSDIDLVVIGGPKFEPTNVFCIADELYRLTGKDVDVYDVSEIDKNSNFYRTIFSEGVHIA